MLFRSRSIAFMSTLRARPLAGIKLFTIHYYLLPAQPALRARGVCSQIPLSRHICRAHHGLFTAHVQAEYYTIFLLHKPTPPANIPSSKLSEPAQHLFSSITLYVIYCNMCQSIQNHNSQHATTHSATARRRACVHAQMPEIRCPV